MFSIQMYATNSLTPFEFPAIVIKQPTSQTIALLQCLGFEVKKNSKVNLTEKWNIIRLTFTRMSDLMPLFQMVEIWSTKLVSLLTNLLNSLREIDFDDFLGNVVAVADKNGTANIVPYVNYQAAQAQAQFTTTNIKADGKKNYNAFTKK